ncbi:hypothetical protein ES705_30730 [subsurface metagenome]
MEAFGSIGYILLTTGLMTFTQTATGSYDVHFKSHEIRKLGQIFNDFNLRGLYSSKKNEILLTTQNITIELRGVN